VDANLREQFDRAVTDDPGADAGEMAAAAIVQGARVRRRRRQLAAAGAAAGLVGVLGIGVVVHLQPAPTKSAAPAVTVAAAMMPVAAPSCSVKPVESDATDVAIFLAFGATAEQRSALASKLEHDSRVGDMRFEDRAQAYQRFRNLWVNDPDFVASVSPANLPELFRVRLVDPRQYTAFRADYAGIGGVDQIAGRICPAAAPLGGVK
jgi:hypothetical protein